MSSEEFVLSKRWADGFRKPLLKSKINSQSPDAHHLSSDASTPRAKNRWKKWRRRRRNKTKKNRTFEDSLIDDRAFLPQLTVLKELMDFINDQNEQMTASRLEWLIIYLIIAEVLLQAVDILLTTNWDNLMCLHSDSC